MNTYTLEVTESETYNVVVKAKTKEDAIKQLSKKILVGHAIPVSFEDKEFSIKVGGVEIL